MIYLFLLGNKPFKKENIESYIKPGDRKNSKSPKSPKKMIASPSKNTQFSPYKKFGKRKSVVLEQGAMDNLHKMMDSPTGKNSPNLKTFKRRKSVERKEPLISLINMGNDDEKKEKEIDDKRVHQIANIMNKKKKYNDGDIELKPAYKQSKKKKTNNPSGKDKLMDEDEEKIVDRENESEEDSESEENYELDDDEEEIIKYEGYLYKLIEKKCENYILN